MIDFRYHVVSLVAVLIALAIGIVLGAGPLREGISDTLEGEVSDLRAERVELRDQVNAATTRADAAEQVVELLGARTVAGTLSGVRVGVVSLPGTDRNTLGRLEELAEQAGATVVLTAELGSRWEAPPAADERAQLATELAPGLEVPEPDPDAEGAAPVALDAVLAASLSGADAPGAVGSWLAAVQRLDDEGLLDLTWRERPDDGVTDRRPPQALLVVGGSLAAPEEPDDEVTTTLARRLDLVRAVAALRTPLVLTGSGTWADPSQGQDAVVVGVRDDGDLAAQVSTVDNGETASGRVAATLGLAWELEEEAGHYGLGDTAQAPSPAPPPLRLTVTPVPPPGDAAGVTEPVPDEGENEAGGSAPAGGADSTTEP